MRVRNLRTASFGTPLCFYEERKVLSMWTRKHLPTAFLIVLSSCLCIGQEVHVTRAEGIVMLTVNAQEPYSSFTGEQKSPYLAVACSKKGKNVEHKLLFSPQSAVVEYSSAAPSTFDMTINGASQSILWDSVNDIKHFTYPGNEKVRLKFINLLLDSGSVYIRYTPAYVAPPPTSGFDLSKLRDAIAYNCPQLR